MPFQGEGSEISEREKIYMKLCNSSIQKMNSENTIYRHLQDAIISKAILLKVHIDFRMHLDFRIIETKGECPFWEGGKVTDFGTDGFQS